MNNENLDALLRLTAATFPDGCPPVEAFLEQYLSQHRIQQIGLHRFPERTVLAMLRRDYFPDVRDETITYACGILKAVCTHLQMPYLEMTHFAHIDRTARYRHVQQLRRKGLIAIPKRGICELAEGGRDMILRALETEEGPQQPETPVQTWTVTMVR